MTSRVLDVRADDLATATAVLQRLGVALFADVFGSPGSTPDEWFEWPQARILDRIPLARLGWRNGSNLSANHDAKRQNPNSENG